eukprot:SAG31_NODE_97_length_25714_cov_19.477142_11_plen_742_part_00
MPGSARVDAQVEDDGDGGSRSAGGARQRRMDEMFAGSSRAIADAWASPGARASTPARGTGRRARARRGGRAARGRRGLRGRRGGRGRLRAQAPGPSRTEGVPAGWQGPAADAEERFGRRDKVPLSSAKRGRRGKKGKDSTLKVGFWNSCGLSVGLLDTLIGSQDGAVQGMGFDILGLAELHGDEQRIQDAWGSPRLIAGEAPRPRNRETGDRGDPASGVALLLSSRMAKAVRRSGCVGSRVVYAVFEADPVPLSVVVAYIPHHGRVKPAADDTWAEVEKVWGQLPAQSAKILLTDANGRLARTEEPAGVSGRWSLYSEDNELGTKLRRFLGEHDAIAASTFFQPKQRRGGAATFVAGTGARKKGRQLDYVVVDRRWRSNCVSCRTQWKPSEWRWSKGRGVKYDHGMLVMKYRMRLCRNAATPQPDVDSLQDPDVAEVVQQTFKSQWDASAAIVHRGAGVGPVTREHTGPLSLEELNVRVEGFFEGMQFNGDNGSSADGQEVEEPPLSQQLARLVNASAAAMAKLPAKKAKRESSYFPLSEETLQLKADYMQRATRLQLEGEAEREERLKFLKLYCKRRRQDKRRWVGEKVAELAKADEAGQHAEVARIQKKFFGKRRGKAAKVSSCHKCGHVFESEEEALASWNLYMRDHWAATSGEALRSWDELPYEERPNSTDLSDTRLDGLLKAARLRRAAGVDGLPVEFWEAVPEARAELFRIVREMWRLKSVPADFARFVVDEYQV